MSGSPRQSPEEQDIYVAIPPPLVSPLARQLGSSQDSGSTHHLPTPISTNNSSISQSYAYWTMDNQHQRAAAAHQDPNNGDRYISGLGSEHVSFPPPSNSTSSTNTPVPSSPGALPTQLLNRLYSFSSMVNPITADVASSSTSSPTGAPRIAAGSGIFIYANPATGGSGSSTNARSSLQYPSLGQSPPVIRRVSLSPMTESTRNAATAAIVDTLSRGESHPSRGNSPYIPSSLSMLFSDPEIMLAQEEEEVERAQLHQQQQQMRQRYMDSQRSFSIEHGVDPGQGSSREDEGEENDSQDGRNGEDRLPLLSQSSQRDMRYGFEVVQDDEDHQQQDEVYHPYATVMSRNDYIAPHEPSSSSPLFPSPLTTLGRFTRMADPLEAQRSQVGRAWQDYGSINNLQQHRETDMTTPLSQSHAAYYHAVSNYHYSSQEDGGANGRSGTGGSSSGVQPCTPAGHVAVPGTWEWRRNRGRDFSQHSYISTGAGGGDDSHDTRSWFRCRQEDRSEENWLCGLLVSVASCWSCCSGCCR